MEDYLMTLRIRRLSMKQGSLLCFVTLRSSKPWHFMLISSKSSQWVQVHWLNLRLFGAMVWKLLIIEPFFQWKINKIEIKNYIGI
jgi:hypothetical protein